MTYAVILIFVFLLSPFILSIASRQDKKSKTRLKLIFLSILISQVLSGFLNWENFNIGRSGYDLSLTYPNSLLGLFFVISLIQIILLVTGKSFNIQVVVINFFNTVLIFTGLIRLSNILGFQAVSFTSIGAVFLVLVGNVSGLAFINKDKNLLTKFQHLR